MYIVPDVLARNIHEDRYADIVQEMVGDVIQDGEHNQADAPDDGEKERTVRARFVDI